MELSVESGAFAIPESVHVTGTGSLTSAFDVTGLAVASIAAAALAIAELVHSQGMPRPAVTMDRDLASAWFGMSFTPSGWELPSPWDALAGDYPCADGWIRLHTNAPHHRAAALKVLGLAPEADRAQAAQAVARWDGETLETAVVAAKGCAALMRSRSQWLAHPQGAAIAAEPLVHWGAARVVPPADHQLATPGRPLAGVRVLDLTRVIAGPVATRFLAQYGAQVLRIDPPDWQEPALEAEMTLGKNCARLDAKTASGMSRLRELLTEADILVHGYRPGALAGLGLSEDVLAQEFPGLVCVALDAYGFSGPWAGRRGFDSLVQMSCGIAEAGMTHFGKDAPFPLPVQALDHATGYLLAATAVEAWRERLAGRVLTARLSLARTAVELLRTGPTGATAAHREQPALVAEHTAWGPGFRSPPAIAIDGVPCGTRVQARGYGSVEPVWPLNDLEGSG
ncbi:CoA transferase [Arthrobacter sp. GMC3]|uniref:CoA transferase n=1 Tax=Arthrobacter sp. GMC3 TaxID=2058894 RepID=UPI000CE30432|nr:CoA transferase [Arthrobacter sp. GMC3]